MAAVCRRRPPVRHQVAGAREPRSEALRTGFEDRPPLGRYGFGGVEIIEEELFDVAEIQVFEPRWIHLLRA